MERFLKTLLYMSILMVGLMGGDKGALAAIPPRPEELTRRIQPGKLIFITEGVFTGGETDHPLSLLDLKVRQARSGERERLELQFSDQAGQPIRDKLGYVHVAVEKEPARIVIDLSQVHRTSVDGETLQKFFARSKNIKQSIMTMDPEDHSTNITLILNQSKKVAVTTKPDELGHQRLIVEIRPEKDSSGQ